MFSRICFTSFASEIKINNDGVSFYVYQREICPKTKAAHYQGFLILNRSQRIKKIKQIIGDEKAHIENAKGTNDQCIAYCTKSETRDPTFTAVTYGSAPISQAGKRTDWDGLKEMLKTRTIKTINDTELIDKFSSLMGRYKEGVARFCKAYGIRIIYNDIKRTDMTKINIISGPSGCGKTTYVKELKDSYYKDENHLWWDNYDGQENVIVNDYTGCGKINPLELLKLADHAPLELQQKGGSCQFTSKVIWITTNLTKDEFFRTVGDAHKEALNRRITWYTMKDYKLESI